MTPKPNILVVCGRNKRRSRTASHIFKNDSRFNIRSAGLSNKSDRKISEADLLWADMVLVMEDPMKTRIRDSFRNLELPNIEVLGIDDEYEYLDPELIELLTDGINKTLRISFKIK